MIKCIPEYLLGYSETPSGTTVPCFLCKWTEHILRSVFSAIFTIYLLRVWLPEQKVLQGTSQQLMPSCRTCHLAIYAGCGKRAGIIFTASLLTLCFWDALIPWRPNSPDVQCRSVPPINSRLLWPFAGRNSQMEICGFFPQLWFCPMTKRSGLHLL